MITEKAHQRRFNAITSAWEAANQEFEILGLSTDKRWTDDEVGKFLRESVNRRLQANGFSILEDSE